MLWRLTALVALANLLLGLAVLAQRGPDGLVGQSPRLEAGATAQVSVDELLVRDGPGTDSVAVAVLADGADVELTGAPTIVAGRSWWPVRFDQDGATETGYVWAGGITAAGDPGLIEGIRQLIGRLG